MKCIRAYAAVGNEEEETVKGLVYRINKAPLFCAEHQDFETIVEVSSTSTNFITIKAICCEAFRDELIKRGILPRL